MKTAFKKIVVFTLLIGTIGFSLTLMFGQGTVTFLSKETYNGITFYKYDFFGYIENIRGTFTDTSKLYLEVPTLTWNSDLINNIVQIAKVLILLTNITIYPLRIAFWIIGIFLSILGVNMTNTVENGLSWLINLCNTMTNLQLLLPL